MTMFGLLYDIITVVWGFSPIVAVIIFSVIIFVLIKTIKQTYKVATIKKRNTIVNKRREIIGVILLWILTLILWAPWWLTFISVMISKAK